MNNIIRNFAQAPDKEAALALIDRAVGLRRGAVQAMQRVHLKTKVRVDVRDQPSMLAERGMSRRVARAFAEILPGLAGHWRVLPVSARRWRNFWPGWPVARWSIASPRRNSGIRSVNEAQIGGITWSSGSKRGGMADDGNNRIVLYNALQRSIYIP